MRLLDFMRLPDAEKLSYLYSSGVYLAKRKEQNNFMILFQVEGFYVEIFYIKYRRYISQIECFDETDRLDPYLEQIDVEHLV